jgi:hypothetical protein
MNDDRSSRPWGSGRPIVAVSLGLLLGGVMGGLTYHGFFDRGRDTATGSILLAVIVGSVITAGTAWTMYRKGF